MESLAFSPRQLDGSGEQSQDSGRSTGSVFRPSNPDTSCNGRQLQTTIKARTGGVLQTTNTNVASNGTAHHTAKTDKDLALEGTLPSDSRKRRHQENHGDSKRRITSEACTGAVFPAPKTAVASCHVMPSTTTTNNTGADCASTTAFPIDLRKRKQQSNGDIFCSLFEPTGEELGTGCFGSVSTYRNKETGKEFAVKVMKNCRNKKLRRVLSEIETCQRYRNSENILHFVDFYRAGDTFFLMFDKMAGGDLRDMMSSTPYLLSESQASRVTGAVARALLTLHTDGVAHRDLKPENILCRTPGKVTPLVLCDLGLASELPIRRNLSEGNKLTKPALTSVVGCPQYMAPEVAGFLLPPSQRRTAPYDTRCDMWGLGVLIYEMLFDCLPFVGHCAKHEQTTDLSCRDCDKDMFPKICSGNYSIPTNTRGSLSDRVVDLIRNLLVVDPQARYSAAQVLKHPFVTAHRNDDVTRTDCLTASPRQSLSE
ncbi:MAP kinase-interacting serine/threonine-protein kinase 1-like [Aplysia californica]|uniref:MAP kinase-interacting serine/threonine-protein kinase 1-like n=1 Tax=Aplysia californica TaxID=6500 RepID=A0ABM0K9S7_APLCA|nr:MAP kinase-interacting serine/threonine-protein kinase 1-like [Aplysia californica]